MKLLLTVIYVPIALMNISERKQVTLDVMNVYKLDDGKVKEWQLWSNYPR
jgi:hypothetical protein